MIRFIMMRVGYGGYDYTGDYDGGWGYSGTVYYDESWLSLYCWF